MLFEYVGNGENSPESIKFMGKVKFKLKGKPVDVTDPAIIAKLQGNKSFKVKLGRPPAKKKAAKKAPAKKKAVE